jgi:hypothetical protein
MLGEKADWSRGQELLKKAGTELFPRMLAMHTKPWAGAQAAKMRKKLAPYINDPALSPEVSLPAGAKRFFSAPYPLSPVPNSLSPRSYPRSPFLPRAVRVG